MYQRIPDNIIEEVKSRTDIVDVVSNYVAVRKKGKNFFGLCPFHNEKTPSFSVNVDLQIYHCFGCGVGGNVFSFVMEMEKVSFVEAVKEFAKQCGVTLPSVKSDEINSENDEIYSVLELAKNYFCRILLETKTGEVARDYLTGRDLTAENFKFFEIGFSSDSWDGFLNLARKKGHNHNILEKAGLISKNDKGRVYDRFRNRIMFPIYHHGGRVVGFGGRTIEEGNSAKYINSPETPVYNKSSILYGLNYSKNAVRKMQEVIIVEGYMDFIRLFSHGIENVVASSGTALTSQQARIIKNYSNKVYLIYDGDNAGIEAALRGFDVLLEEDLEVKVVILEDEMDPDDYVIKKGAALFKEKIVQGMDLIDFKVKLFSRKFGEDSVESRTKIVRNVLETVALIKDSIKSAMIIKDLAERFGLDEKLLKENLQKILYKKSHLTIKKEAEIQGQIIEPMPKVELDLIKTLLLYQGQIDVVFERITAVELNHPTSKIIFEEIRRRWEFQELIDIASIISTIEKPLQHQFYTGLFVEIDSELDMDKFVLEIIAFIKRRNVEKKIKECRTVLKRAQTTEGSLFAENLINEITMLLKEKEQIQPV